MSVQVVKRGPFFVPNYPQSLIDAAEGDCVKQVAVEGAAMVRSRLNAVLRKQTPIYRFKVKAEPNAPGWMIHDQRMIYGPWLEGTGSRNRTTRFKGYRTFRIITQELNGGIAQKISERIVARYVGRMS